MKWRMLFEFSKWVACLEGLLYKKLGYRKRTGWNFVNCCTTVRNIHGRCQESEVGGATWGKGQSTGGKGNRCEWIKCLPEGTLPKPTFRLGATGRGQRQGHRGQLPPAPFLRPWNNSIWKGFNSWVTFKITQRRRNCRFRMNIYRILLVASSNNVSILHRFREGRRWSWPEWTVTCLRTVTHLNTNRTRRRVTLLMRVCDYSAFTATDRVNLNLNPFCPEFKNGDSD